MTVKIPGYSTITGAPQTILDLMAKARIFEDLQGEDYIAKICEDIKRGYDISLRVSGETIEERAESLLLELARSGFIKIEEE